MNQSTNLQSRFDSKIERIPFSGCWLWTGSCGHNGYGFFRMRGKVIQAHRASFEMFRGDIPSGLFVCHHCDVPCCVNPDHLFIGTRQQNVDDAKQKGRHHLFGKPGTRHYLTTFTNDDVIEIRRRYAAGETVANLMRSYNKSRTGITWIVQRKSWRHLQ